MSRVTAKIFKKLTLILKQHEIRAILTEVILYKIAHLRR